jgi:T-complex protein 1 subunit theta
MHKSPLRTREYVPSFPSAFEIQFLTLLATTELSTNTIPTPFTQSSLTAAIKPAIASKQYGYEDTLSSLVAEAALAVMPSNPKNFNVDNVRVVKIMGGSLSGSRVVRGMVFGREPEGLQFSRFESGIDRSFVIVGIVKKVTKAKVAVFTSALDIAQTETKGTVLLKTADEMLNFTSGEEKHLEKVVHLPPPPSLHPLIIHV